MSEIVAAPSVPQEREIKEVINQCFSKFEFQLEGLNDKYQIKMEDLSNQTFFYL